MLTYDDHVKLALHYADEARKHSDRASYLWRMAVHYQMQAASGGEPPDIGEMPDFVLSNQRSRRW
jgi:hypothetical protein